MYVQFDNNNNYIILKNTRTPGSSKRQGACLRAGPAGRPGFDPGCRRGGDFSTLLHIQIGPGVH